MSPKKFFRFLKYAPTLLRELHELKQQARTSTHQIPFGKFNPYPHEKTQQSGTANGHYFHQDLLVARRIYEAQPVKHVDVGSRVDGFVAHVAAYRPIEVLDIRPLDEEVHNIHFKRADLMNPPAEMQAYCDSLSCLHAIEHFGLARYGDPVDFEGHVKGLRSLHALLKDQGTLYLSCPIGPQRIEFNAHRVFSIDYLLSLFEGMFEVQRFSYVDDPGNLHEDVALEDNLLNNNAGCRYGCGIFELRKISA